jgi:hypothetical protein
VGEDTWNYIVDASCEDQGGLLHDAASNHRLIFPELLDLQDLALAMA